MRRNEICQSSGKAERVCPFQPTTRDSYRLAQETEVKRGKSNRKCACTNSATADILVVLITGPVCPRHAYRYRCGR